jgi:tetratricopeptide (TPR) repeat protein
MGLEPGDRRRTTEALAALAVLVATLAVFWPALGNGFIDVYDDGPYVLENLVVRQGLTPEGISWALGAVHSNNWHPLTWLAHMLDVQLFGLEPWGHHLGSLLLHAASAALLVFLASSLGLGPWAAVLVGLAFGVHPLRVQSVAWVAERKDVLSGFLGLLTLLAWVRWLHRPRWPTLAGALAAFALGLLAKPMLVSLPGVMLLLAWWPLGHTGLVASWREERKRLLLALLPFLALALAVSIVTLVAQTASGAIATAEQLPIGLRLANAALAVWAYLGKFAWPAGLAVFYPHPGASISTGAAAAAGAAIAVTSMAAVAWARQAPYLLVGWGWYLGMLLPVLGVVQAGRQSMADRYTYLPAIGILLALAWAAEDLARRLSRPGLARAMGAAAAVAVCAWAVAARAEIGWWRDSRTLFTRAREVTGPNAVAANALGVLEAREGRIGEALALYQEAVAADPAFAVARQNLAGILMALGREGEALPHAAAAVQLDGRNPRSHFLLGAALEARGLLPEAAAAYEAAIAIDPRYEKPRQRLGAVRAEIQRRAGAP